MLVSFQDCNCSNFGEWNATPLFLIMQIQVGNREDAIRALINTWLKMPTRSCASCGRDWDGENCCNDPVISNNYGAMKKFLDELKDIRESRRNKFASNSNKTIRWGVSIPANLYNFLNISFNKMYHEKLFNKDYDMVWFAKKFPQFKVPQEI